MFFVFSISLTLYLFLKFHSTVRLSMTPQNNARTDIGAMAMPIGDFELSGFDELFDCIGNLSLNLPEITGFGAECDVPEVLNDCLPIEQKPAIESMQQVATVDPIVIEISDDDIKEEKQDDEVELADLRARCVNMMEKIAQMENRLRFNPKLSSTIKDEPNKDA